MLLRFAQTDRLLLSHELEQKDHPRWAYPTAMARAPVQQSPAALLIQQRRATAIKQVEQLALVAVWTARHAQKRRGVALFINAED